MKCGKELLLALITTIGFFGCLWILADKELPQGNKDLLNILLGVLATSFTTQMQYFFGTTSSSRLKDETIAAAANKPQEGTVTTTTTTKEKPNVK
jgi:hypothetical protein